MTDPSPVDFLGDPLSEITRKERRNLLIASIVGLLVSKAGLIPTKLSALGIQLSAPAQDTFVILVAVIIFYFMSAFFIYGISDFLVWRNRYQDHLEKVEVLMQNWSQEDQHAHDELQEELPNIGWLYRVTKPVAFARILFEYAIPFLFGIFVIITLIRKL